MEIFNKNILSGLCILAVLVGCGEKTKDENNGAREAQKVSIQEIKLSEQDEILTYSGSVEADNTVSIGFSVAGRVTAVHVQEGERVSRGQLLASIEQNTYLNNLAVATAGLEQAEDNFNRLDQLYKKNSLPERDYIAAKVALAQTKANHASSVKNLEDTKLYAAFSGIVTKKQTEAGATAAPGVPAFTIVKTDKVYATASITESEISSLNIGADATISIPSLNQVLNGKISIINPQADNSSRTYTVKVRLDNPGGKLLPGMIADIKIKTGKNKNSIVIPALAIVRGTDNINYVFVATSNSTAFKKRVAISKITGSNEVIVSDGLQAGDKLIVTGQTNLEDGKLLKF
ncbi:efflux RND transporter periplasmic adaptor subunit [Sphingobacterium olei]|uniref:Efflux RND transporter periplasmic adaptor subunit n=1 Tax=Sphingobacterium olei TaxID=2571155 RepID=A0A4U0NHM5_9SPHI|nr:efflux RND transporter periplasmic adaptor subunit [Sphingobacterium olei]TJZ53706.1 efflux RND transporter periplasmic adaptor subunit [Sphingobacterium olei]